MGRAVGIQGHNNQQIKLTWSSIKKGIRSSHFGADRNYINSVLLHIKIFKSMHYRTKIQFNPLKINL